MTPRDDGGSAFPTSGGSARLDDDTDYAWPYQSGMSLRDYFAGQILSTIRLSEDDLTATPGEWAAIAMVAYRIADAMLAERKK